MKKEIQSVRKDFLKELLELKDAERQWTAKAIACAEIGNKRNQLLSSISKFLNKFNLKN